MDTAGRVDAGLSRPLARPTFVFGMTAVLVGAVVTGLAPPLADWRPAHWLILVTLMTNCVVVTTRRPGRLSAPRLSLVLGLSAVTVALIVAERETVLIRGGAIGQICLTLSLLVPRGHPVIGTLATAGALAAGLLRFSMLAGWALSPADHVLQPLAALVACWFLFLVTRFIASRRSRTLVRELGALAAADAERAALAEERRTAREVAQRVEPLLQRIVAGEGITAALRAEAARTEEEVRELIRGDMPRHPGFRAAVAEARRRGVNVRVIGSGEPVAAVMLDGLADPLVGLLGREDVTKATIRFLPRSRDAAATVLLEGPGSLERFEFDADGAPLGHSR
ncbi:hypothetical protein [Microbacterium sp. No. 7]|uniref:hypothetical protein n=1 Tax=Microbacterium sp. No. 7 TaxID=1714373 RepID=UPI0006D16A8F|nr:hypothetical protein [Microbacterium sp. No. 7]ALJ21172.1 hypothetical protein AOA12_15180 [Microbacterium sp. No. 7]